MRLQSVQCSQSYLIVSFENRPATFLGWMSKKVTKAGFSFLCLFYVDGS